ncbi:MAG TPA: trypsin-like serine protease, partial [Solirubrobacterales bacterium]
MSLRLQIAVASALSALAVLASPAAAVINGTTAGSSSWPWAVQVLLVGSSGIEGICGGTLVAPTRVVTAGSCTTSDAELFVIANRKKLADESGLIEVVDFQRAPEWSSFSANDVAVLTLAEAPDPATPIELLAPDESGEFPDPSSALLAGWGATDTSPGDPSETLQQGQVTLQADCSEAGTRCSSSTVKPCNGDLGGPVIVQLGGDTVNKDPSPDNGTWRLVALPLGGPSDCSQTLYVDLTQPDIQAFIENPGGEQPGTGGGNPPPTPSLPAAPGPV